MIKLFLTMTFLCVSPVVFAQQEQATVTEEDLSAFMAKSATEKQSTLMDLLSTKDYEQAGHLLAEWEKTAPEGEGPNSFLKSYVENLIKAASTQE